MIPAGLPYCSVCGHGNPGPRLVKRRTANVGLVIAFVLVGVPSAICGGCILILSGESGSQWYIPAAWGLAILAIPAVLLWQMLKKRPID